jgi:GTP cyclohydrolase I
MMTSSLHPDVYTEQRQRIGTAIYELLIGIDEDPERDGLKETPNRVAEAYLDDFCVGYLEDPLAHLKLFESGGYDSMVIVKDIPLYSLCEHHLVPFFGKAHVGYLPGNGKVVGLSKIARVVDAYAKRLQVQERLSKQIADCIEKGLQPHGVIVIIEAEHLCMTMRGVEKPGTITVTSTARGKFLENEAGCKDEFLRLIGK